MTRRAAPDSSSGTISPAGQRRPARWATGLHRRLLDGTRWVGRGSFVAVFLALFVVLILVMWPWTWGGNEDHYLMLAHRAVRPDKFSEHSAVFDSARGRFLYMELAGQLVDLLGYANAHALQRALGAALYAASLTAFMRSLGIGLGSGLLIVVTFIVSGETVMGGEWLFHGMEPKTFAYCFVVLAFASVFAGRLWAAVLCCVAATYLHFLVGGFWILPVLALHAVDRRDGRIVLASALYLVGVAPLVALIIADQFGVPADRLTPSTDYIYSILRNPHHVAPFAVPASFPKWIIGAVATLGIGLAAVLASVRLKGQARRLAWVVAGVAGFLLLAFPLSWLDRDTGYLGKFYLFRPASFFLFLAITTAVLATNELFPILQRAQRIALVLAILMLCGTIKAIDADMGRKELPARLVAAVAATHQRTGPQDVVLVDPDIGENAESLERLLDRPTLVRWKFVPTYGPEIRRWFELAQKQTRIFRAGCQESMVPVTYLLALHPESVAAARQCGPVVWSTGGQALIRVKPENSP